MKKFWGKNMKYWFMGEKYEDLLRKNENLRGKRWKKGGKGEIFTILGEKISIWKRGDINF